MLKVHPIKNILETVTALVAIYAIAYLLTGVLGGIANIATSIYALRLLKGENYINLSVLIITIIVANSLLVAWTLIWIITH